MTFDGMDPYTLVMAALAFFGGLASLTLGIINGSPDAIVIGVLGICGGPIGLAAAT